MEIPRLGSNRSCSCWSTPQPQQSRIRATSSTCATACGNLRSLAHRARPGIEPASLGTLCQVLNLLSHNRNSPTLFKLKYGRFAVPCLSAARNYASGHFGDGCCQSGSPVQLQVSQPSPTPVVTPVENLRARVKVRGAGHPHTQAWHLVSKLRGRISFIPVKHRRLLGTGSVTGDLRSVLRSEPAAA